MSLLMGMFGGSGGTPESLTEDVVGCCGLLRLFSPLVTLSGGAKCP